MKVVGKDKVIKAGMMEQIKREICVMKMVRHPNIVELHEVMASTSKVYFSMELVKGGELFSKVEKGKLREDVARSYFQQLISAVDFCHSRGVYHHDLKPENLLLDDDGNLKVEMLEERVDLMSQQARARKLRIIIDEMQRTICEMDNLAYEGAAEEAVQEANAHMMQCTRETPPPTLQFVEQQTQNSSIRNQQPETIDLVEEYGWARSVEEFCLTGDRRGNETCCYIVFLGRTQVPREFWSTLLDENSSSVLFRAHIDCWVRRWMRYRLYLGYNTGEYKRWTIMPTKFESLLLPPHGSDAVKYADGSLTPYPAWGDVDVLYIPLRLNDNVWLLVQMDLVSNDTSLICSCRRSINHDLLKATLKRWRDVLPSFKRSFSYEERNPQVKANLGFAKGIPQGREEDSAVFVCKFMHYLVTGKSIKQDGVVDNNQIATGYRQLMARDLYSYRILESQPEIYPFRSEVLFDDLE